MTTILVCACEVSKFIEFKMNLKEKKVCQTNSLIQGKAERWSGLGRKKFVVVRG